MPAKPGGNDATSWATTPSTATSGIPDQTGTTSYAATNAAGPSPVFYRGRVGN